MSDEDLLLLLEQSRNRNKRQNVTGMLLYVSGNFFQVLEGDIKDVEEIYEAIVKDERNKGNIVILKENIKERTFPNWSMGFEQKKAMKTNPYYMSTEQIKQLAEEGFTLGSHTVTHTKLMDASTEQIEEEIHSTLRFSLDIWDAFGFKDIKAYLATRPGEKSVGEPERWEQATVSLRKAIDRESLDFELDEGGGAFYGPKIDLKVKDSLGREWQMTTIQFDFNLPERFDMTYIGEVSVLEDLRNYAVSRIYLDNIPHIKAYWPMTGRDISQLSLSFGTDDMDGTIEDTTKIYSMAGSKEENPAMTTEEICDLIREAGYDPVERDTVYNILKRW